RLLNMFEDAIVTVLLPKAIARPVEEVVALTGRAVRVSTFLTLLCIIPLMLLCPVLLSLLYGSEFMGAVPVFRILLIEIMFNGMTWVLAQAFMASGQPGTVTLLQGVGLGLTVPLMLVLIPKYQLVGAGLSLLCSTLARFVFILVSFPLVLKISPPRLLITREDWRYLKQIIPSNT
ncbi:MAG: polysaccharide biosynthesis C-terminal domain-containing protein, partial [Nostoc sp. C3-bin3]|nr:polysaccharide biosynthesis C-terminal domain-containing protein [Nostoc sp. C3-bin3]